MNDSIFTQYKPFNTSGLFVGGSGIFLQYYDIVKPIFLYAVISLMIGENSNPYGLPVNILQKMTIPSLIEWYKQRRYINPLYSLDYNHEFSDQELDTILGDILKDPTIYKLAPVLNIDRMLNVYRLQHMNIPIYIYTKSYSDIIKNDIDNVFRGISHFYVHGDIPSAIKNCRENFTYIFSDIELMSTTCDELINTFNHILIAGDYRYNYHGTNMKYDLKKLMSSHQFIRTGVTTAFDYMLLRDSFVNISLGGDM